jgi:hypothetical protein
MIQTLVASRKRNVVMQMVPVQAQQLWHAQLVI